MVLEMISFFSFFKVLRKLIPGHSINQTQQCTYAGIHLLKAVIMRHCLVTAFQNYLACLKHTLPSVSGYKIGAYIFSLSLYDNNLYYLCIRDFSFKYSKILTMQCLLRFKLFQRTWGFLCQFSMFVTIMEYLCTLLNFQPL